MSEAKLKLLIAFKRYVDSNKRRKVFTCKVGVSYPPENNFPFGEVKEDNLFVVPI